jgi:hypothetical protein
MILLRMNYFKRYRVLLIHRGKLAWKSDRRYFKRFWERERVAGSGNARGGKGWIRRGIAGLARQRGVPSLESQHGAGAILPNALEPAFRRKSLNIHNPWHLVRLLEMA